MGWLYVLLVVLREEDMVSHEQPASSQRSLEASDGKRTRLSGLGGDCALVRTEDVGGAELQASQTCSGLERLPDQERHCDKAPLAAGVLRVLILLVGLRALAY